MRVLIRGAGVAALALLTGCAGSPAWHQSASPETLRAYYADWEVRDLCARWDEVATFPVSMGRTVRGAISNELRRRGDNPDRCYNADRVAYARAVEASQPRAPVTVYQPPVYQAPVYTAPRSAPVYSAPQRTTYSSRTYDTVRCDSRVRAGGDIKTVCR